MNYPDPQRAAGLLPPDGQQLATMQQQYIQPLYPEMLPLLPHYPDPASMGGYRQQPQQRQQPSNLMPLLIVTFLSGGLIGGLISFLVAIAIIPRNPPPIINNPAPNITNPDCVLFCR